MLHKTQVLTGVHKLRSQPRANSSHEGPGGVGATKEHVSKAIQGVVCYMDATQPQPHSQPDSQPARQPATHKQTPAEAERRGCGVGGKG